MLRLREWLEFKPEDSAGKFEVLVTTGHDRIFGDMVKQQRMEARKKEEIEYYKKKKAQKEKADAEAKAKKEAGGEGDEKDKSGEGDKEKKEKGKNSDTSTKKVKDGVEVDDKIKDVPKNDSNEKDGEVKLMVAVPVKTDGVKDGDLDAKHDQVAMLAGPGEAAAAIAAEAGAKADDGEKGGKDEVEKGEKKEKEKEKEVRDPMRDAEKIAQMMGKTGNLKMEDIQIALKVLEAASGMSSFSLVSSPILNQHMRWS